VKPQGALCEHPVDTPHKRAMNKTSRQLVYRWACVFTLTLVAVQADAEPIRFDDWIPTDRVSLRANFRTRYEYLSEQFRAETSGSTPIFVLRTLIHGRLRPTQGLTLGVELEDSRAYDSEARILNTGIVDATELLQAYAQVEQEDILGGQLRLTGGRITMNVGSRRFVARNRFRNTINSFTGVDLAWKRQGDGRTLLRAFWTLPVQRLPGSGQKQRLQDNDIEFDQQSLDLQFWGLYASHAYASGLEGRLSLFGLHERDTADRPSRDRKLYTMVLQVLQPPAVAHFDFQVEGAIQWGQQRRTSAALDTQDLSHLAHFEHLELGYTFDAPWSPRAALQWDYASGDRDATDRRNGRFDTLFGARRFDFGPTGIYGPFARSNLMTPGVRLQFRPLDTLTGFVAYRAFWLAQERDFWVTTSIIDPTGDAGRFVANQIEWRIRWSPFPGNLRLELGYARLFAGEYMRKAPTSPNQGDSSYVYTQAVLQF